MFFDLLPGSGVVCAHRGARSLAPENTLPAALAAALAGAHCWETDVRLSADGVPVLLHDETLERTTDAARRPELKDREPWPVNAFTSEELHGLDAGSWFAAADPFGTIAAGELDAAALAGFTGVGIPTLAEALALSRSLALSVNVELKEDDDALADAVLASIRQTRTEDMVLLSSFHHRLLRTLRAKAPHLPLAALAEAGHPDDLPAYLQALGAAAYHPDEAITDPALVAELGAHGIRVCPFTVNDTARALHLLDAGCLGVITDVPQTLRKALDDRG